MSLARAPGLVLVTVSAAGAALGVDVEAVADRSRAATALGEADAAVALRRWVRTEAVLKATGHGLQVDPRLVGISDGAGRPRLASWPGPGRRPRVRIADVEVAAGYVAAVAGLGSRRLRLDSGRAVLSAVR